MAFEIVPFEWRQSISRSWSGDIEIKPFEIAHLQDMELREPDLRALEGVGDIEAYIDQWTRIGLAFTAFVDGRPICAGGVMLLRQGVGEVWTLTTPLVEAHPLAVARFAMGPTLPMIVKALELHRVQVSVQRCHRASRRLVERLGFTYEGLLHRYGSNGEDYVLYAAYPEG